LTCREKALCTDMVDKMISTITTRKKRGALRPGRIGVIFIWWLSFVV
jgi:hypothetical protein